MRLLADENIPRVMIDRLIAGGHDVLSIGASTPGLTDLDVFQHASLEGRVCLTFDKDFGEVALRHPQAIDGLILLRVPMRSAQDAVLLADIVSARTDWAGHFSVVEPGRTCMRKLPLAGNP